MAPFLGLRGTRLLYAVAVTAGMGFTLYGVDNASLGGVISSTPFENRFRLSATGQGAVTGAYELGCFAGALLVCVFGERLSRRHVIFAATIPLMVGAAIQVSAFGVAQLTVGRVIAGVGMGGISTTVPIWQNETAPARLRGTLMCCSLSCLIVGQLVAYFAAYGLVQNYDSDLTWRVEFSLQMMAAVVLVVLLYFMPESPRFLVAHEKYDEARIVIAALLDVADDDAAVAAQIDEIARAVKLERESAAGWGDLVKRSGPGTGESRRMLTAVAIQVMQAFSGSTVISYYVTTIFEDAVGLSEHLSTLLSGFLQVWFLFASLGTWYLIEHVGRRIMFLFSATMMAVVMFLMGGLIKLDTHGAGIGAAIMVFAYQAFFTWGWMAGVWVYSSEINPLSWRTKGMGLAVALQWLFDFVLLMVTPIGIANIGYGMFFIFAIFNLAFIPFVYLFCPETAGIPLELIDDLYLPGRDPVKESVRLRSELKKRNGALRLEEAVGVGAGGAASGKAEAEDRDEVADVKA
ncbi:hypothetical protein Q5752_001555 [Cryptotrichosporon argae]